MGSFITKWPCGFFGCFLFGFCLFVLNYKIDTAYKIGNLLENKPPRDVWLRENSQWPTDVEGM